MAAVDNFPFFLSEVANINIGGLRTIEQARAGIMSRFIGRAKQVHQVGTQDLLNAYRQWDSATDGSIANLITQELEQLISNYNDPKMTGASFAADVQNRIDNGNIALASVEDINYYAAMAEEIEHRLNSMIDILMQEQPTIEVAALCNCIGRKIPDPELASKYEGKGFNIGTIEGKKAAALQILHNYYMNLAAAGKGNVAALALENGTIPTPADVAEVVAGALSSVAGESFYEILVQLVANRVMKQFNAVNKDIIESFLRAGFSLRNIDERVQQSADVNSSGQQGKPDLYIYWGENGLILRIGGSVKLRQANRDFVNSQFVGNISYKLSLREIFGYGEELLPGSSLSLQGALGAILREEGASFGSGYVRPRDISSFGSAWDEIKQRAIFLGIVDKFAGTGETNKFGEANFADVLIVNQMVIPMYDIFRNIADKGFSGATTISGGGWTWTFGQFQFPYWYLKNRRIYHDHRKNDMDETFRKEMFDQMMKSIYNKKIYIAFSPKNLTK